MYLAACGSASAVYSAAPLVGAALAPPHGSSLRRSGACPLERHLGRGDQLGRQGGGGRYFSQVDGFRKDLQVRPDESFRQDNRHVGRLCLDALQDYPRGKAPSERTSTGRTAERSLEAFTMMRLGVTFTTEMLAGVLIMSLVNSISCRPSLTPDRSTETRRLAGFRRLKACSGPDRVPFASVIFVPR